MKYQYNIMHRYIGEGDEKVLEQAGADGWELVTVYESGYGGRKLYLKRAIDDTSQLSADLERIGAELATMQAANAELQARLNEHDKDTH